jgi:hypothetical protein
VTVTVVTGHSVALSRRSHLFSTMSSLHDVLVHDNFSVKKIILYNAQLNVSHIQKWYQNDILWYFL